MYTVQTKSTRKRHLTVPSSGARQKFSLYSYYYWLGWSWSWCLLAGVATESRINQTRCREKDLWFSTPHLNSDITRVVGSGFGATQDLHNICSRSEAATKLKLITSSLTALVGEYSDDLGSIRTFFRGIGWFIEIQLLTMVGHVLIVDSDGVVAESV